ncbi:MAG TPA: CaiB/BaiF CoA-transferase family protein [Candidatus Acidoferrales bacterium]|nr:CaiB/BaiF CoA-transferase family protein [Candidatus Acidoferrales bacterium]
MKPLPLAHVRMLDLSRQLPGPFCSTLLADFGADVLCISNPGDPLGVGIPFLTRNKRSMTLNLKSAAGRDILLRLAADADVVLEGYRPGVPQRLGIDYETLRQRNPRLIYCSISGYGQDGPYRDRVGHDINYIGTAGVLNFIGEAGGPPVVPGVQIADIAGGGLMAAVGILTAIIARAQTGHGQFVDISMLDGTLSCNAYHVVLYLLSGSLPRRGGEQLTGRYPCYAVYETRDGRYVTVGAFEPHFWTTLCRHFGREDFIEAQWDEGAKREEMFAFFRAAFRQKALADWLRELGDKETCFGAVNRLDETFADPQLRHRQMIVEMDGASGRTVVLGTPIKLSDTPASLRTPPPSFGAHTDEVLERLGFTVAQIAQLRAEGVV